MRQTSYPGAFVGKPGLQVVYYQTAVFAAFLRNGAFVWSQAQFARTVAKQSTRRRDARDGARKLTGLQRPSQVTLREGWENLSAKRRLALLSWHGWATNKQEKFKALDHHGCLACSGRVDLLPEIAMKLIRRNQGLRHRGAVQALSRCTKIP
jgi:hypothetical protein